MIANIIRNAKKTATGGDPYYSAVSLLLPMDGTNGSTTFTDSSLNGLTVTSSGVTISDTGARSGFGQFADFPGSSSSALTIPASSVFNFGTGDFTIEFWFNIPAGASGSPYGKTFVSNENNVWSAGAFSLYALASSTQFRPSFWINEFSSSVPILLPSSGDYRDGNWHHLAVVRSGSAFSMYIDGVRVANGTHAGNCGSSTRNLMIGDNLANNGGDRNFLGKLDDLRISQFARYVSNFTPPTTALPTTASSTPADPYYGYTSLLLRMDGTNASTNFVDSGPNAIAVTAVGNAQISTTQSKYGGASAYFDGSGDYLTFPTSTALQFGSGDFTVEMWVYKTSNKAYMAFAGNLSTGTNATMWQIISDSTGNKITWFSSGFVITGATTLNVNTWYHVAVSRNGTNLRLFINGILDGSATNSHNYSSTNQVYVAQVPELLSARDFAGYLDDLRITRYARYTSAFTPPTQAHLEYANGNDRHFSNVSLLLHMDGANGSTTFTDNSANALAITRTGTAAISTAQSQFGGASAYFDGSTGYLSLTGNSSFQFGTGDFTIEAWVYISANAANQQTFLDTRGTATATPFTFGIYQSKLAFYDGTMRQSSATVTTGQWYHFAACRSSGTLRLFINGVSYYSASSTTNFTTGANSIYIGRGFDAAAYYTNGYIDDLRVTKYARYASTFTPPTTAFPNA